MSAKDNIVNFDLAPDFRAIKDGVRAQYATVRAQGGMPVKPRFKATLITLAGATAIGGWSAAAAAKDAAPIVPDAQLPASQVKLDLAKWPVINQPPALANAAQTEAKIDALIARMTIEEKVGQLIQPEILNVTPEDVRKYHLGSVLNGGNGRPNKDPRAPASEWLKMADAYYDASVDTTGGRVGIPIIWGTDSVHGNNSIFGGTIFPHNIGLGAANDIELTKAMGRITAVETAAMGVDWTFAPAVSIPRDDRWGRSYEGFAEEPKIAGRLAAAYTEGLQGKAGDAKDFFKPGSIIATVKHFIADGGTQNGRDQGDAVVSEQDLRTIHYPPYIDALSAGAQTVMASYSKWNGVRMHGHGPLLTRLLKERSGFDGFVVGDFNGHALIPGCTNGNCPQALMAGVDMYMIPVDWKELHGNLVRQAKDGTIPQARLDDAVRRILRVKFRAGLFDHGRPSARAFAGQQFVGTAEHRAVARALARKSMVLLKDNRKLLPFPANSKVLVTGQGADDVSMLAGGWTMTWQGTGLSNADFPGSTSVYAGLSRALEAGGGKAMLSRDGSFTEKPDYAVVVFGEMPYAEYQGDRESVLYKHPANDPDLGRMRKLQAAGIPVIGVFLSGRPLWINPQLNASDAMIAAFLPGTEGGGAVTDMIVAGADRKPRHDFTGRLSFSWPANAAQTALNVGDKDYKPLFPFGYGLSLANRGALGKLPETPGLPPELLAAARNLAFFNEGRALAPWRIYLGDSAEGRLKTEGDRFVTSRSGAVKFESADRVRQEDSKLASWTGKGRGTMFVLGYAPVDFAEALAQNQAVVVTASVNTVPQGKVEASFGTVGRNVTVDATSLFKDAKAGELQKFSIPLQCFAKAGGQFGRVEMPLMLATDQSFALQISGIAIAPPTGRVASCAQ